MQENHENTLKVVKESGIGLTGLLFGTVLNYVLLMVLTRWLDTDAFGTFVLAQSVVWLAAILVLFGSPRALDRYIPLYRARNEPGRVRTLVRFIAIISIAVAVLAALVLWLLSPWLAGSVFRNPLLDATLALMALTLPLIVVVRLVSFAFAGLKEMRYEVYLQHLATPLSKIALGLVVLALGLGYMGWLWAYVAALAFVALLAVWFVTRRLLPAIGSGPRERIDIREIVAYSWPLGLTGVVVMLQGQIDVLFLGRYGPPADVGIYRIYIQMCAPLLLVMMAFARIYKPVLCELIAGGGTRDALSLYRRVARWIMLVNALGFLLLVLYGREIVALVFPVAYAGAPAVLGVLVAGRLANTSFGPEGMTLEAFGNTKLSLMNAVLMLAVNVGVDLVLVPRMGLLGAAIGATSATTIGGLAGVIEIRVLHGFQPYTRRHLGIAAAMVAVVAAGLGARTLLPGTGGFWLAAHLAIAVAVYALVVRVTGVLDDTDRAVARRLVDRARGNGRRR
ncbi:MAG: oligosaccharide flippase family protein [Candidatus Eisenbacteria bacterium]|nr:oligosaccharide flippase family protein [Candidatus Eisenbacteria bacterium]